MRRLPRVEYVVTYAAKDNPWGWSYRYFRTPRSLVKFLKRGNFSFIIKLEEV